MEARVPEWINYHHLLYFRTVAREGSITRASELLGLAQPTISGQIRALEETLGAKLFMRKGRNLVMTDFGRRVFGYADQIFSIGEEMGEALRGTATVRNPMLRVGTARTLSDSLLYSLVTSMTERDGWLCCRADSPDQLLASLIARTLDLVFTDLPLGSSARSGVRTQVVGSSGISLLGTQALADSLREDLANLLPVTPMLMPVSGSGVRLALESWFAATGSAPKVVGEIESEALAIRLAENGTGLVAVPSIVAGDIQRRTELQLAAELPDCDVKIYAVATEGNLAQPGIARALDAARQVLSPQLAAAC